MLPSTSGSVRRLAEKLARLLEVPIPIKVLQTFIISLYYIKELNANDVMVILNAIYFKGDWQNPFSASSTWEKEFHSFGKTLTVPFLNQTSHFNFAKIAKLGAKVLQMEYKVIILFEVFHCEIELFFKLQNNQYSMVVVLPNREDSLSDVEQKMKKMTLSRLLGTLKNSFVAVSIPKFKIEADFDLNKSLEKV